MWNSQSPLNLLLSMPNTLTLENLQNLQEVIDVDKIINSRKHNRDLCGEYAPFCDFCDKSLKYPCAHAYVKMKQADGLDVEIDEKADVVVAAPDIKVAETEPTVEKQSVEPKKEKKVIRIAHIKRTK